MEMWEMAFYAASVFVGIVAGYLIRGSADEEVIVHLDTKRDTPNPGAPGELIKNPTEKPNRPRPRGLKEPYASNIAYYDAVLQSDDKWHFDSFFMFLLLKLKRSISHYTSDEFQSYAGSNTDLLTMGAAEKLCSKIVEQLEEGTQPSDEDVADLMDLIKTCHKWWD